MATDIKKEAAQPTELENLKTQADILKLDYKANITAKDLRKQIMAELTSFDDSEGTSEKDRADMIAENTKLVRCMVMPVAAHMRDYQGQLFGAGNSVLGIVSKFVLFNTEYQVPNIILKQIQAQEMQFFTTRRVNGQDVRESKMRKAFNVDILDQITQEELDELSRSQENRHAIDA